MGYIVSLIGAFLLAVSITIIHFAYQGGVVTEQVVFIRFFTTSIVLVSFVLWIKKYPIADLKSYFNQNWLISIFFIIQTYGYVMSIKLIPIGLAAIIFYSFPLITYVMQVINRDEQILVNNLIAIALGLLGVYFTLDISNVTLSLAGIGYAVMAAFSQAFINVLSQPRLKRTSADKMMCVTGIQCCLILPLIYLVIFDFSDTVKLFDISMFYHQPFITNGLAIALLASFFFATGITLYFVAVKLSSATKASIVMYSEPAFTVLVAAVLVGEIIGRNQIIGLVLIISAGLITQIKSRPLRLR